MQIFVNGTEAEVEPGTTLADFVETLDGDPRGIAIELNLEIVPKSLHGATVLQAGDRLEIVQFVGGG